MTETQFDNMRVFIGMKFKVIEDNRELKLASVDWGERTVELESDKDEGFYRQYSYEEIEMLH